MLDPGDVFQPPGLLRSREAITGARSLTANDNGLLLEATSGSGTIDGSAVTLGAGFKFTVYNSGSGSPVFDPALTQTVRLPTGTVSTVTILQGQGLTLVSDGTNWIGVLGIGFAPSPSATLTTDTIQASTTAGILLRNSAGTQVMSVGLTGTGVTFAGAVTANGGTVQIGTADINSGAIDGTTLGVAVPSSGAFTTVSATGTIAATGAFQTPGAGGAVVLQTSGRSDCVVEYKGSAGTTFFTMYAPNANYMALATASRYVFGSLTELNTGYTLQVNGGVYTAGASLFSGNLTLSSGSNLAMSGASTLTTGTGLTTASGALTVTGAAAFSADITLADGVDIATNATTGSQIATATTQKLALWGATPVVQLAAVADASGGATVDAEARTAINTLLARLRTFGQIAP